MENKRFVLFLVTSLAILSSYMLISAYFFPKPPPDPAKDRAANVKERQSSKDKTDDDTTDVTPEASAAYTETDWRLSFWGDVSRPESTQKWISLGSMAPDSPYRFLVIFNTRGASIEWIELNERTKSGDFHYRDLEDKSGYLANMALTNERGGGCRVNVVGVGTPAALAQPVGHKSGPGLKPGDVILEVGGKKIESLISELKKRTKPDKTVTAVEAFHNHMEQTHPNDELQLVVRRGGKSLNYKTKLTWHPLEVIRPEPEDAFDPAKHHPYSFLLSLGAWGKDSNQWHDIAKSMRTADWEVSVKDQTDTPSIEFLYRLYNVPISDSGNRGSFEIVKRFTFIPTPKDQLQNVNYQSYHMGMEIEIRNVGTQTQTIAYQLNGPTSLPLEGWWYSSKINPSAWFASAGARDVVWKSDGKGFTLIGAATIFDNELKDKSNYLVEGKHELEEKRRVKFIGVDTKYFVSALLRAEKEDPKKYLYRQIAAEPVEPVKKEDKANSRRTDVSFFLRSEPLKIEPYNDDPKNAYTQKFVVFAGPKQTELLKKYEIEECIAYGWFGIVSKSLVWLLQLFDTISGSYAIAIIMLTVLVRACMIPISLKATKNAQMMQLLQPEMKKIADKYKNDMEKRAKAQQELFRKHNYHPMSGCLLMFLQLPIFIGLYRALYVDITARGEPLIPFLENWGIHWCSNLAAPDMLFYWGGFMPSFIAAESWGMFNLGPYFNLLPIITIFLFVGQQKMFTPPPTDDQQKMQQTMMKFMTIFIGIMFFKVPSGLCLYIITSSLWGLFERKFIRKPLPTDGASSSDKSASKKSPTKPGPNGSARKERDKQRRKKSKGKR